MFSTISNLSTNQEKDFICGHSTNTAVTDGFSLSYFVDPKAFILVIDSCSYLFGNL